MSASAPPSFEKAPPGAFSFPCDERTATVDAIARVLGGERAEHVVPSTLRALDLDNAGRARVARRIYAVSVLRLRLAFLAGVEPLEAGALLDAYCRFEEDAPAGPSATATTTVMRAWPADRRERLIVERSCPRPLADALIDALGFDGADAFLGASNVPGPKCLRANTLRCTRDQLRARLAAEGIGTVDGAVAPHALVVVGHANLFGSAAWRDGWFEVQDEASQLVAEACGAKPGDVVVDLCAGRGGKTLALAASMQDRGVLHVHDVDERALADMTPRLQRAGVTCVRRGLPDPGSADVVLVDAPCSSTGVLRRSPDLRFTFRPDDVASLTAVQRALLQQGARLVRAGGRLVYATCSVLRAENEGVLAATALDDSWSMVQQQRTLLPHVDGTDGFFLAALCRAAC